ncbi:hypothetical protein Btru_075959 [Bulinus truncatus]|nr:hypothetical protein Btru_075959 [Bulinus truncatus]
MNRTDTGVNIETINQESLLDLSDEVYTAMDIFIKCVVANLLGLMGIVGNILNMLSLYLTRFILVGSTAKKNVQCLRESCSVYVSRAVSTFYRFNDIKPKTMNRTDTGVNNQTINQKSLLDLSDEAYTAMDIFINCIVANLLGLMGIVGNILNMLINNDIVQ